MICIVSPHFDDAALSCADHALAWVASGLEVWVLNVFTASAELERSSALMDANLQAAGASTAEEYMALRRAEDRLCMQSLGLQSIDLGLVDAGFRGRAGLPDYDSLAALRPGRLGAREAGMVDAVAQALPDLSEALLVLCPLGVGGHVDHLIARAACEARVDAGRLAYYADMPYARAPWNWARADWARLADARRSFRAMTAAKRGALRHYQSQWPLLFGRRSYCPELLLLPRR